ncbi:MAG: hypothetical protein F3745_02090 [Nitrospinae bacterium]|nr:hypothetical protein [Nitrospinota bacterium]
MIRINLHDYRYELRKIEIQKRVVKCSAIIIASIFFVLTIWLVEQTRLDSVRLETSQLKSKVTALEGQYKKVKAMEARQNRMETIIKGIDGLREKQAPANIIVSDLNMTVPEGLWLSSIMQKDEESLRKKKVPVIMFGDPDEKKKKKRKKKKKDKDKSTTGPIKEFVEVSGYSLTEKGVVEYMKRLQKLAYYKTTFLYKSSRVFIGGESLYNFIIYCYMPEKKKSA